MSVLIKVHSPAVDEILKSQRVESYMKQKADAIAARANADAGLTDGFLAVSEVGKTRARAAVVTATAEAMVAEATNRTLTRALDAGR